MTNFSTKCKFELECNVDYLNSSICDEKQFGYYRDFRSTVEIEEESQQINLLSCFEKFRKP